jgi:site-specific DNA-methyltransferase (adenine-specific)
MKVHFTSNTNEWYTPDYIFRPLNERFKFTLDPCCTKESAKCKTFYTVADDGLSKDWGKHVVWVNPPYGRAIGKWIKKCYEASRKGALVVMLIPARTDTQAWFNYVRFASEIIFIKGRVKFINKGQVKPASAPFPSAIVVFGGYNLDKPTIKWQKFDE